MATHLLTMAIIAEAVDGRVAGDPFDAAAKDAIIADAESDAKTALTNEGYTEASDSLAITIDGDDVMWFDYNQDTVAHRCKAPLAPNLYALVGGED